MPNTVLILGATGKVGSHSASAFHKAGWQVRLYDRAAGDMTGQAKGADVIVNGLNPPNYHNWVALIPAITAQVIAAAKSSGATVIIPGNVYNFGTTAGPWSEHTPQLATTRKGRIRIEMENAYRDAGVRTIILRAGNFIDPHRNDDVMSLVYLRSIARRRITSPGDPDVMQAFCFLLDWARAAVGLASIREQLNSFEDVPFPGHAFSVNDLRRELQTVLGQNLRLVGFPWLVMKLTAPFWELARELNEMRYLWNTPHQLDGRKFARLLPDFQPTSRHAVMTAALPPEVYPNQPVARNSRIALP